MKEMFYTIASAIAEWITGCDGTGVGIEGMINVIRYINVLENVKLFINITTLVLIGACLSCIAVAVLEFADKKLSDGFVSIKVECEK